MNKNLLSTLTNLNTINIGLMIISLGLAYVLPFEIFLLSYAVLGPLHYLTELSWLKDKNFFLPYKSDKYYLLVVFILIMLGSSIILPYKSLAVFQKYCFLLIYLSLWLGVILALIKTWEMRLCALGVSMVGALILTLPIGWFIFIIYLPTLIHVYVFTALFILFGASKNHDKMGYWSVLCLLVCGTLCFILPGSYHASQWAMNGYNATFGNLSMTTLENVFGLAHNQAQLIYTHPLGLGLGRFIGFAYTYHYLNWFSKTKVIGWHNISVKRLSWVIVFWIACISIYLYDYLLGFKCLFALSFLHVVLEFPLNAVCVSGIYKNIKNKSPKLRD